MNVGDCDFVTDGLALYQRLTRKIAAVATLVIFGKPLRNFGLLDITPDQVEVRFIAKGADNRAPLRINRTTWQSM